MNKRLKRYKRYNEITSILIKYGLSDHFPKLFNNSGKKFKNKNSQLFQETTHNQRIRLCLQELGTTFIKLGQMLSNRPDLFSDDLLMELQELQEHVLPFDSKVSCDIIEEELKQDIKDVFKTFDVVPLASASIAQVHKATLFNNDEVIVKVQRPNIIDQIEIDTDIMLELAKQIERFVESASVFNPVNLIIEFKKSIKKETNFINELNNIKRYNLCFENDNSTHVPKVYQEISTSKVLTMEFIDGFSPFDNQKNKFYHIDSHQIASTGTELVMKQIFDFGFFHADPHAGNIKITKDSKVVFIDFGMMGHLSNKNKLLLADILWNFIQRDTDKLTRSIIKLTKASPAILDNLETDIEDIIDEYYFAELKDVNFSALLSKVTHLIVKHKLLIPSEFYMLAKSLATIEGVARGVYPNFNMIEEVKPYVTKMMKKRFNHIDKIKNVFFNAYDSLEYLANLPKDIKGLIDKISIGETTVKINHTGLDELSKSINNFSNKLSLSLVLSGFIVASSLITLSKIPPYWNEIPIIGLVGFILSGFLSIILIIQLIKK